MDWNTKAPPSWDFSELEQETFSNLDTVNASNSFVAHKMSREDFSIDLKLGQVGNSGHELVDTWKDQGLAKPASSPSGSSKRSRGSYNGSQAVSCLVDGCNADLSGCRDYHRRHKVCELHSKTPQVTIGGHKQRFCQQCSRFHSLEEFDEGKRSCRKRLDGHNRRRRKPQPEPFSRYGNLLSNYPGTQLLQYSTSLVYPSTTVVNPTWGGGGGGVMVKTEAEAESAADSGLHNQQHPQLNFLDRQNMFLGSTTPICNGTSATTTTANGNAGNYNNNKSFLLQGHSSPTSTINDQTTPQVSVCHPLLRTFPSFSEASGGAARSSSKVFYDRLLATTTTTHPIQVHNSDCALSLLSSPQTSEIGLGHNNHHHHHHHHNNNNISQLSSFPMVHQPVGHPTLHANGLEPPLSSVSGMFHFNMGSDGNEAPQTLPSHWE